MAVSPTSGRAAAGPASCVPLAAGLDMTTGRTPATFADPGLLDAELRRLTLRVLIHQARRASGLQGRPDHCLRHWHRRPFLRQLLFTRITEAPSVPAQAGFELGHPGVPIVGLRNQRRGTILRPRRRCRAGQTCSCCQLNDA